MVFISSRRRQEVRVERFEDVALLAVNMAEGVGVQKYSGIPELEKPRNQFFPRASRRLTAWEHLAFGLVRLFWTSDLWKKIN